MTPSVGAASSFCLSKFEWLNDDFFEGVIMTFQRLVFVFLLSVIGIAVSLLSKPSYAKIASTHVYHNHMPNFWPYFDVDSYEGLKVGDPIRYTYDGQVILIKKNPPPQNRT